MTASQHGVFPICATSGAGTLDTMTQTESIAPSGAAVFHARQRWEYKVLEGSLDGTTRESFEDRLNRLGDLGWDVCGFEVHRTGVLMRRVILKRPTLIAALADD